MKRVVLTVGALAVCFGLVMLYLSAQNRSAASVALLQQRAVTVHALEEVTKSPAQILDITSSSARLNFVGTLPLACTVVYGTTPQFGAAAVDTNMNGGAIVEHNPVLRNLQPDTTYYYRLQGSDENGTFYISKTATFHTSPTTDQPVQNLLSPERGAQVIGVSSNFGAGPNNGTWGILNAFDGDPNTEWSSNGDGNQAWFEVRLAQRSRITKVEFWSRVMSDKTAQVLAFTVTTDNGTVYGPFKLPDASQSYTFPADFVAMTLRFSVVDSTGGNTGAKEVAVYGTPASN